MLFGSEGNADNIKMRNDVVLEICDCSFLVIAFDIALILLLPLFSFLAQAFEKKKNYNDRITPFFLLLFFFSLFFGLLCTVISLIIEFRQSKNNILHSKKSRSLLYYSKSIPIISERVRVIGYLT